MYFSLELILQGYDVARIGEQTRFLIERTVRCDVNEWAKPLDLHLEQVSLRGNEYLRPGIALKAHCRDQAANDILTGRESEIRRIVSNILAPHMKKYFDLDSPRFVSTTIVLEDQVRSSGAAARSDSPSPVDTAVTALVEEFQSKYFRKMPVAPNIDWQAVLSKMLLVSTDRRADILWDSCLAAKKRGSAVVTTEDIILAIDHFLSRDKNIETTDNYIARLAEQFIPITPDCDFGRLIITDKAREEIELALVTLDPETLKKYISWGLLGLDKHPRTVLNFYGPPGTGKTMAAHAIAQKFGKKIILANCHSLQSKWHGESSKNVKAIFWAAQKAEAILFFDEADSLISQRLEDVHSGSEDEINNMRNTILTCLEEYTGIVIFASNFVKRYDFAFETRIQSVLFPLPDEDMLQKIWKAHVPATIPGFSQIDFALLAKRSRELDFCGRDVKNAVIRASKIAIAKRQPAITTDDLLSTIRYIFDTREAVRDEPSPIRRKNRREPLRKSVDEIVEEQQKAFYDEFFADIVCAEDLDINEFFTRTQFVADRDIRQIVSKACLLAKNEGRKELRSQDLSTAYDIFRPQRTREETYDLLMDAVQTVIDQKNLN